MQAHSTRTRPFGLADAMLLVVAVATGLWINRGEWYAVDQLWRVGQIGIYDSSEMLSTAVTPHLAAVGVALLVMRMRRPRPTLRRLANQPGATACMAASTAVLAVVVWMAIIMATGRFLDFSQNVEFSLNGGGRGRGVTIHSLGGRLLTRCGDRIGFAVAGAWIVQSVTRRWRPERSWIDRLGRGVGWLWLILAAILSARIFLI